MHEVNDQPLAINSYQSEHARLHNGVYSRPVVRQHLCALVDASDSSYLRSAHSAPRSSGVNFPSPRQSTSHSRPASPHSRKTELRGGLPESLREWACTFVGARYSAMLPTSDVSCLPSPARASILASRADFIRTDRGHVRAAGDATADSRLRHFARWLDGAGYSQQSAWLIDEGIAVASTSMIMSL